MKLCILVLVLLLVPSVFAATGVYANGTFTYGNKTYNVSEWDPNYNFAVKITVSDSHTSNYTTVFNRPGNFTLNYSKTPKSLAGVTPQFGKSRDLTLDQPRSNISTRLDPRTCPNDIAFCYQLVERLPQNRSTFGKNYTAVSSYLLPSKRIKPFPCIGNDTACTQSATNCFCPEGRLGSPPILRQGGSCSSTAHICQNTFASFTRCIGNLSHCQEQYLRCGCGATPVCPSEVNTCITKDHALSMCKGKLPDCLSQNAACFCGPDAMFFLREICTSMTHQCLQGTKTITCAGTFTSCALRYDKCDC